MACMARKERRNKKKNERREWESGHRQQQDTLTDCPNWQRTDFRMINDAGQTVKQ
jgi:hypothetical protein